MLIEIYYFTEINYSYPVTSRNLRYASYRQFTWWVHNRLGRHVRRVIPSCAISRIRAEFEEEDGDYSAFDGDDRSASEIVKAMEWTKISDSNTSD